MLFQEVEMYQIILFQEVEMYQIILFQEVEMYQTQYHRNFGES